MPACYFLLDAMSDAHPVQAHNRVNFLWNQEERFGGCFGENYVPRSNSYKPGKESRIDRTLGAQDISILENKLMVSKRDSDHVLLSLPGSRRASAGMLSQN